MVMHEQEKRNTILQKIQENVFVEAGAGAGKTTLIISRLVNQLKQGIKPEHVVVITFTNAAAEELYGRMSEALAKELSSSGHTEEEQERLQYALEHMDRMTISTIHSFCFKLLKERCFDAKLPMDMTLLEPQEAKEYQQAALKKWMRELDRQNIEELREACKLCFGNEYYRDWLEKAYLKICDKPEDVQVVLQENGDSKGLKQEIKELEQKKEELEQQLEVEIAKLDACLVKVVNCTTTSNWSSAKELAEKGYFYADINYESLFGKGSTKDKRNLLEKLKNRSIKGIYKPGRSKEAQENGALVNEAVVEWLEQNKEINDTLEALEKQEPEFAVKAKQYFYFVLMSYAKQAAAAYKRARTGQLLTNDEILERARDLVCSSKAAREYFADRYRCIYVDEFQDTDHIQAELVWKLSCDDNGKLRPGSLFVVGDPKQAIYRFRGGEPAVYYKIKKRMEEQGAGTAVYELSANYRSNQKLIDWINKSFKEPMEAQGGYTDMQCMKPEISEEKCLQGVYTCDSGAAGCKNAGQRAATEAKKVVQLIQNLMQGQCLVRTDSEKKLCPIQYQDFLILCWDKYDMNYYVEEFRKQGIPVELSGTIELEESRILNGFCRLYGYLASKGDRKAKEGTLPVVARENTGGDREEIEKERLELLKERTKGMDGYALAHYLASHPEYLTKWIQISKQDIYVVQVLLLQMVETVLRTTRGTAVELAEAFRKYMSKELERELPLQENQNAVRFMNLHKAKGLEGTITIVTKRRAEKERAYSELTMSEPNEQGKFEFYGVLQNKWSSKSWQKPDEIDVYKTGSEKLEMALKEDREEAVRLEYVAATRAKEALVVMSALGSPAPLDAYLNDVTGRMEDFLQALGTGNSLINQTTGGNGTNETKDYIPVKNEISEELKKATYVGLSPSQLESRVKKEPTESESALMMPVDMLEEDLETEGMEEDTKDSVKAEKRPKGKVFGTVMHRSYELLVNACWEDKSLLENASALENVVSSSVCQAIMEQADDLEREGKWLYFKGEHSEENYLEIVRDYLVPVLRQYASEGVLKEFLQDAVEVYTEFSFSYYICQEQDEEMFQALQKHLEQKKIQVEAGKSVWINGTADLIIRKKDDRVLIVDYKSDSIGERTLPGFEEVLKERYAGQMLLYRYSMGRLFQVKQEKISVKLQHLYEKK